MPPILNQPVVTESQTVATVPPLNCTQPALTNLLIRWTPQLDGSMPPAIYLSAEFRPFDPTQNKCSAKTAKLVSCDLMNLAQNLAAAGRPTLAVALQGVMAAMEEIVNTPIPAEVLAASKTSYRKEF